jgi:superoxide dismutase, Fe-Mn family
MEQTVSGDVLPVPITETTSMYKQPPLPYAQDALMPHVSAETMDLHYNKHHAGYAKKLNDLIADTPMAGFSLTDIIMQTHGAADGEQKKIFNNAAQCWNHEFFWSSMTPDGGGGPTGKIAVMIDNSFGDAAGFGKAFKAAGEAHFGSGWVWLVETGGNLEVLTTANAELPLTSGKTALLVCDVWEHAYYLDYQNKKPEFLEAYLTNLVNWEFANANIAILADA